MHLLQLLQTMHVGFWAYAILFLGMLFEGTLFLLTASFLIAQGVLNPWVAIPLLIAGSFLEEVMWYWVGKHLSRWRWFAGRVDVVAKRFDQHILSKTFHIFNLSKYVYGIHRPIIARSGMLHMELRKFLKAAWTTTAIWLVVIGALGVVSSASFDALRRYVKYAEIIPLLLLIIFYFLERYISSRIKKDL